MNYKGKSRYLGNPSILAHPEAKTRTIPLSFEGVDGDVIRAGTPITVDGCTCNDATAMGILLHDVWRDSPMGTVVIDGDIDRDAAEEHSGLRISDEALAALNNISVPGYGPRGGGGGSWDDLTDRPFYDLGTVELDLVQGEIVDNGYRLLTEQTPTPEQLKGGTLKKPTMEVGMAHLWSYAQVTEDYIVMPDFGFFVIYTAGVTVFDTTFEKRGVYAAADVADLGVRVTYDLGSKALEPRCVDYSVVINYDTDTQEYTLVKGDYTSVAADLGKGLFVTCVLTEMDQADLTTYNAVNMVYAMLAGTVYFEFYNRALGGVTLNQDNTLTPEAL